MNLFLLAVISNLIIHSDNSWAYLAKTRKATAPYYCNGLQLKKAAKSSTQQARSYEFAGICSVKISTGDDWIYKQVWIDLHGHWDKKTNTAIEVSEITAGGSGKIQFTMKCDDDPWTTNAKCLVKDYKNTTEVANFKERFKVRKIKGGTTVLANYPPLARAIMSTDQVKQMFASPDVDIVVPPVQIHPQHVAEKPVAKPAITQITPISPKPETVVTTTMIGAEKTQASHTEKQAQPKRTGAIVHVRTMESQIKAPSPVAKQEVQKLSVKQAHKPAAPKKAQKEVQSTTHKAAHKHVHKTTHKAKHKAAHKPKLVAKPKVAKKPLHHAKVKHPFIHPIKPKAKSQGKIKAQKQVFRKPSFKGHRIAWCYHWGAHCGKAAADAWCKHNKFKKAKNWKIEYNLGKTLVFGDGRLCLHKTCAGFSVIECEKKNKKIV